MLSVEYLAGFIDGEGSLSLARIPRRGGSPEYCLRVTIANTNRGILREIKRDFGGTLATSRFGLPNWKVGYALIWTNAAAAQVITKVEPHLRVKSAHAQALLEFAEHVGRCRRRRDRYGRLMSLSSEELKFREEFHGRLKLMNTRGPSQGPPQCDERGETRAGNEARIPLEYLAGFIDGEGSVMITKSFAGKSGSTHYRARLTISNTDRRILEEIRRDYGGIIVNQGHTEVNWKVGYQLVWTNEMMARLLPLVRPYLRLKQRQADLILRFGRHVRSTIRVRDDRGLWAPHTRAVMEFREALYRRMRGLNAKGPHPVVS